MHLLCRNRDRGEEARQSIMEATGTQAVELHVVDVSSLADVRRFAQDWLRSERPVQTLVNNAGAYPILSASLVPASFQRRINGTVQTGFHRAGVLPLRRMLSPEGMEVSFATMFGGTFLLTSLLLPVRPSPFH